VIDMTDNKKFTLHKAPFIRKADNGATTTVMMRDFMIALAPLILFAWVKNGLLPFIAEKTNFFGLLYPLLLVLVGGATSFLCEFLWYYFLVKKENVWVSLQKSYPLIPGILLGMIVPLATPLWLVAIGAFFATVIGKLIFGGFGNNIFNPALIGYLFLTYAYFGPLTGSNEAIGAVGYFNAKEVADAITSATPMTVFAGDRAGAVNVLLEDYGLWKMFLGLTPGSLAETSALLCLVAFAYLTIRKTINWRVPVIYVGTVFVLTYIIGAVNGYAGTLSYALFGILNGGLMFGAVFMATEPVTSPRNPNGIILYSLGLGVLTVLFRFASSMPEGVATSILIMNMFTALLERFSAKLRVEPKKAKVAISYALIGLLFTGIGAFAVAQNIPKGIEFVSAEQDFATLDFNYTFKVGSKEVLVIVDQNYEIKSIEDSNYNTDRYESAFSDLISGNKLPAYVAEVSETAEELLLTVKSKGFGSNPELTSTVVFDPETLAITGFETNTRTESYTNSQGWNQIHPDEFMPGQIIANQSDLSKVQTVTGATVTSNSLVEAARQALQYKDYLAGLSELVLVNYYQSFDSLNFVYIFRNGEGRIVVEAKPDGTLVTTVDEALREAIMAVVSNKKLDNYIAEHSESENKLVVKAKGYASTITATITYDPETYAITGFVADTTGETYGSSYEWAQNPVHPKDQIPNQVIANQDDLSKVQTVTGATVTSKAIISAARIALDYLAHLGGSNE